MEVGSEKAAVFAGVGDDAFEDLIWGFFEIE